MTLRLDDLDPDTKEKLLGKGKQVRVGKEELVRAASGILGALDKSGLPVVHWDKALKLAGKWLKER